MKFEKLIAVVLCFVLCAILCPAVSAATTPKIIVSNAAAFPGEEVGVNISINNNPGIMSMVFSVTYNKDYFEYTGYTKGFINSPTSYNHADKGYIAFTVSEAADKTNVGNMLNLTFRVKAEAPIGTYPISIANVDPSTGSDLGNAFSNSKEELIVPTVQAGSIRVKGQCDISGHTFGVWTETKPANCTEFGEKQRTCSVCNEVEDAKIPYVHDYEDVWTIDKPATPDEKGVMSRHCKLCDAVTDELTFSYDEIFDDEESSDDTSSDTTTSDDTSSDDTSSDTTTSEDTSSDSTSSGSDNQKPNIDNIEGEKVPESEAGKLEDFENLKPDEEEQPEDDDTTSENNTPSSSTPADTTSKETTTATGSNDTTTDEEKPFFSTAMGIITIILCVLLSLGIIALGIMLIVKNNKKEKEK